MLHARLFAMRRAALRSMRRQYNSFGRDASTTATATNNGGALLAVGASSMMLLSSSYAEEVVKRQPALMQGADDMYLNVHYDEYEAGSVTRLGETLVANLRELTRNLKVHVLPKDEHRIVSNESHGAKEKDFEEEEKHRMLLRRNKLLFPTLNVNMVVNDEDEQGDHSQAFFLNTHEGIPFENDLFDGRVLLVLKPLDPRNEDDDSQYKERLFSKDIRFEIQIQGRFKKDIPTGTLYCGGELATMDEMKLSRTTKRVAQVLLGLLSRIIGSDMLYSFGGDNKERPHISFPLLTAMDHVSVTNAGDCPPRLGHELGGASEDSDSAVELFNVHDTYTMSFHSTCIDLPTWSIVKPFPVDLGNFWSDSPMRLVVYEKGGRDEANNEGNVSEQQQHDTKKKNNYLFALQFQHLRHEQNTAALVEKNDTAKVAFGFAPAASATKSFL